MAKRILKELERLGRLRAEGILTEEEFLALKRSILDGATRYSICH